PSRVDRPSAGGKIEFVRKEAASAIAIPVESTNEFGAPVKMTHWRSNPIRARIFSPSVLAIASSSWVIVVCAGWAIGTDFSSIYGPIQFHSPSFADLNMERSLCGQTEPATRQTAR